MKKEIVKLKEGNSVIYQDKTLMEKANVVSIDKKNGTAILSNKVIITRTTNLDGQFTRLDGKGKGNAIILPCTTENEQKYNAFVAYHQSKKSLEAIKKWLDDNGKHKDEETFEKVITLDKKLKKLIEKLNE
jgi:predicted Abi (CAAX) family protease